MYTIADALVLVDLQNINQFQINGKSFPLSVIKTMHKNRVIKHIEISGINKNLDKTDINFTIYDKQTSKELDTSFELPGVTQYIELTLNMVTV